MKAKHFTTKAITTLMILVGLTACKTPSVQPYHPAMKEAFASFYENKDLTAAEGKCFIVHPATGEIGTDKSICVTDTIYDRDSKQGCIFYKTWSARYSEASDDISFCQPTEPVKASKILGTGPKQS